MKNLRTTNLFLLGTAYLILSTTIFAQLDVAYTFFGDDSGDRLGSSVSDAGDVNGDGIPDVIVGAWTDSNNGSQAGSARVFSGADGSVLYTFFGDDANDLFGKDVGAAGDINGDGFDDLIVGAPKDDNFGASSGSARVFSGVDGSILFTLNGSAGSQFGTSVDGAGDVNNDGTLDVVVGSPNESMGGSNQGSIRVFSGVDGSALLLSLGTSPNDHLGFSVSGVGDLNNDGFDDVIGGAPFDDNNGGGSGSVRVVSGFDASLLFEFFGASNGDALGWSCADAGDLNNDGITDIIGGAYASSANSSLSGSARVFSGADGSILYIFDGIAHNDRFGWSVSGAGDVNGDGIDDVVIGAINADLSSASRAGAHIYSGADGSTIDVIPAASPTDFLGYSVSGAGDVNGDGFADIIVGAPSSDTTGSNAGLAKLIHGAAPVYHPYSSNLAPHSLTYQWVPTNALTGDLVASGATPAAVGIFGVSLATDDTLVSGQPLLLAVDSINLISSGFFGYDSNGQLIYPNVSLSAPFLAGVFIYVQVFEISPSPGSSNGIRLLLAQ